MAARVLDITSTFLAGSKRWRKDYGVVSVPAQSAPLTQPSWKSDTDFASYLLVQYLALWSLLAIREPGKCSLLTGCIACMKECYKERTVHTDLRPL